MKRNFLLPFMDKLTKVGKWFTGVAAFCVVLMMLIAVVDAIGAKFFQWSMKGAVELIEELMVLLVMLPAGYVALERGHITITLFEGRMGRVGSFILRVFQYVMAIAVTGFLTWRSFAQLQYSIDMGEIKGVLNTPVWPAYSALVLGFGFFTLVWIGLLIKTLMDGPKQ
jgi:TRAP-type mannitol/chloroaromatic compound transport system permease small subunit